MTSALSFDTPLELPCGARLKNRFLKSAMSEQLGDGRHDATPELATLFRTFAEGGTGVLVTGNVMVDRTALGEPKNVVLDEQSDLGALSRWAEAARVGDTHVWPQLNHPGRQSPSVLSKVPVAPSAVPLTGALRAAFNAPRALSSDEVKQLVEKFARAAQLARRAGFTGVQIHGAHGYLVNQFLSPLSNVREDEWGGSAENRRRFLLEVYRAIRAEVGARFPVAVKLNSADFQKGGFTEEESMGVVDALAAAGVDLIEISGGTYEAPAMTGARVEKTRRREAYFLEYAERVRARVKTPLAVTGGMRTGPAMLAALRSGATDLIGLARPLALQPDFPNRLLRDSSVGIEVPRPTTGIKAVDQLALLDITYYEAHLARLGAGKPPKPDLGAWSAALTSFARLGAAAFRPRRA